MDRFILNGCYDLETLRELKMLGLRKIGFDLRARSLSLVPMHQVKLMLLTVPEIEPHLIFENDSETTILSTLDMLRHFHPSLQFRDQQPAYFYDQFETPFTWVFHPAAEWEEILMCRNLSAVVLPLALRDFYIDNHRFWDFVSHRNLDVILHAETFAESALIEEKQVYLSIDLSREIETSYRIVDQGRLKSHLLEKL